MTTNIHNQCQFKGCDAKSLAFSDHCWEHINKKDEYAKNILSEIAKGIPFNGQNLSHIVLRNSDLSRANFSGANLSRADLSGANLFDANFNHSELLGANLSTCDLTSASLEGADLTKANLFGARLWHTNLKNANLIEANLSSVDLWNSHLFNVRLWHTDLTNASYLSKENFSHKINSFITIYRINEKGMLSSEEAYRSLKKLFLSEGRYNDASWASYKEKNMEKNILRKKRNPAYIPSLIMDLVCGYGEKPYRIIISSVIAIFGYGFLYKILDAVRSSEIAGYRMKFADYIYYSIITFTTVGYGDFVPKINSIFRLIAASEAFTGVFMGGLFIFTLARKYSAR